MLVVSAGRTSSVFRRQSSCIAAEIVNMKITLMAIYVIWSVYGY